MRDTEGTTLANQVDRSSSLTTFEEVLTARLSRRRALLGGLGAFLVAACGESNTGVAPPVTTPTPEAGGVDAVVDAGSTDAGPMPVTLGFNPVAKSLADAIVLPAGYTATVLFRLGDPIANGVPDFKNDGTDSGESYAQRAGDHHDGMHFFGLGTSGKLDALANDRALLVLNHEALTPTYLHPTGQTTYGTGVDAARAFPEEVVKEMNVQGVSVIEIARTSGQWAYKKDSSFNRRITTATPIELSGPVAKTPYVITKYSPDGSVTRGTVNNCANGYTPWGTYLTCEENWSAYFRRTEPDAARTVKELASFKRYAITGTGRELWATATPDTADDQFGRWNAEKRGGSVDGSDDYRNVANTFGWVVEIDPFTPSSKPKKRTALGRLAHEGCWIGPVSAGKPLVFYMGCDGRNEYIYKFVSAKNWDSSDASGGLGTGDKYLDEGTLYVAKFESDGSGKWIELRWGVGSVTPDYAPYPFADQADVLLNTRFAADAAGGTKMDRPEWGAVHPSNGEIYFTLTNTNAASRPVTAVDAANPRFYNDPKGSAATAQKGNPNGHIVRLAEGGGEHAGQDFRWDVFIFGARSTADAMNVNVSGLSDSNDFSSPDGCWFSQAAPGLLWIETDDGAYTDVTNCMLLAAIPGAVGDGGRRTIANSDTVAVPIDGGTIETDAGKVPIDAGTMPVTTMKSVETFVGKPLGDANLRRFLVGPKECEITGIAESPDGKALFVNIQHPGEETVPAFDAPSSFGSHWPDGGDARPRSATIVITKDDGGVVGT
ncbi:MAG TPA: PhoX family phosphatase [Polyangiaceae bacterium]|nr:PhoX family phosphatase [Polyangiaceae bacterium]